MIRWKLWFGEN